MKDLKQNYISIVDTLEKVAEYINLIKSPLCPSGDGAKQQCETEVRDLFNQLKGQVNSLKNLTIRAIYEENK